MKCPNPNCNKEILCSGEDFDKMSLCEQCGTRFSKDFDIIEFFNDNVSLFNIYGVFTAIAVILPTFSLYSRDVVTKSVNTTIFLNFPLETKLSTLDFFTNLFVLGCGMMILFLSIIILKNLSGSDRYREVICYDCRFFNLRFADIGRIFFALPFIVVSASSIFYFAIVSGDFFTYYILVQGLSILIIMYLIYRGSPHLFKTNQ